jgi:hypothetical protein
LEPNNGEGRTARLIFQPAAGNGSPAAGFLLDDSTTMVSFDARGAAHSAHARELSVTNPDNYLQPFNIALDERELLRRWAMIEDTLVIRK